MDKSDPSYKGQSGYNAAMLAVYDVWVLKFMTKAVWKVPVADGVDSYRQHMGHRHLDIGPGTGYFIEAADPPSDTEITLLDPNQTVLRHAAKRLERWHPVTVEADVMKQPLPVEGRFDSAALSFVLHCLREPEANKAVAVRNVADVLGPQGVLFGGTVLGLHSGHTKAARAFLRAANRQGGFDNVDDTAESVRRILEASFSTVEVDVVGSAAFFVASNPDLASRSDQVHT
jgi:ubiquinone/menaquinone biosynthesis C-methylase UbiE